MKNLEMRLFLAVVILIISFGNEADSKPLSYAEEARLNEATSDKANSELRHKQRDFLGYPEELLKEVAPEKKEKADVKKSDEARDFEFEGYPDEYAIYPDEDAPEKVGKSEARILKPDPAASNDERRDEAESKPVELPQEGEIWLKKEMEIVRRLKRDMDAWRRGTALDQADQKDTDDEKSLNQAEASRHGTSLNQAEASHRQAMCYNSVCMPGPGKAEKTK